MDAKMKEAIEKVEKGFSELKDTQSTIKKMGERLDSLDDLKMDRQVEEITTNLQKLQDEQTKSTETFTGELAELKAAAERMGEGGDDKKEAEKFETEQKEAFDKFFRDSKDRGEIEVGTKAMSTDVNPDGGYLVRPALANFVVDRVFETSPLRAHATVETIGTKSIEVLIDDNEAAARWVDEGASDGETNTPQLGLKEIVAHKLEADPKMTTEQLEDSYLNAEVWLQTKVADFFARSENTAFVNGNGVLRPRGFLTYDAAADSDTYERDAIGQENLGATSFGASASADGLIALQNLLKEGYQANAKFGMKRASYGDILKSKGNDNYFFGTQLLKDGQLQAQLLGKPVIFMNDMPAAASAALAVVYADFRKAYTIVDRVGLSVLKDPFTNKGFVTYYTTKRVGGDVTNFDAIKIGKLSV